MENNFSKPPTLQKPKPAPQSSLPKAVEAIPGIAELAANFPGGPKALQKVLNNPTTLDFITNNPDIVQKFIKDGFPSPDKLQALLSLAAPPPEVSTTIVSGK